MTIVTSLFFAAIAGTGSAAVAAIGLIMIPAMVKNGYDKGYSSALVATAGTVGVIIPPSVCMVVYAVAAGASISGLFMAGIMPGLLIGAGLIIYSVFYSKKHGYKGDDKRYTLAVAEVKQTLPECFILFRQFINGVVFRFGQHFLIAFSHFRWRNRLRRIWHGTKPFRQSLPEAIIPLLLSDSSPVAHLLRAAEIQSSRIPDYSRKRKRSRPIPAIMI